MIRKYRYGAPFDTEALTEKIETAEALFHMERSARMMDLFLLISWTKMTLSMAWANPIVESIREVTAISATVQMMQFIQRASVLCMELTILLS